MAREQRVQLTGFGGYSDDRFDVPPTRGVGGSNWQTTKDGFLRPGPQKETYTPAACEPKAVLTDPSTFAWFDLRDFATHTGNIYLYRWTMWFYLGGSDVENVPSTLPVILNPFSWVGRYFDVSDLSGVTDERVAELYRSLVEQGVTRVWFLDDKHLIDDATLSITTDDDNECGPMVSEFANSQIWARYPMLVIYDSGCMELTGIYFWDFFLRQGSVGTSSDDFEDILQYHLELSFFATTGETWVHGKSWNLEMTGSEEDTSTSPDTPAVVAGGLRFPLQDQKHLSDPNLVQLGICQLIDAGGGSNVMHSWKRTLYQSDYLTDPDDWGAPGSPPSWYDGDAWERDRAVVSSPWADENTKNYTYPAKKRGEERAYGQNLCEFIDWLGFYQSKLGAGVGWNNEFIDVNELPDDINYESEHPFPFLPHPMNFLVVWEGKVTVPVAGLYRFYACCDEGIFMRIDDVTIFDHSDITLVQDEPVRSERVQSDKDDFRKINEIYLSQGIHEIEVRWWNNSPNYIFHLDICPKDYLIIGDSYPDANWKAGSSEAQYDATFPLKCDGDNPGNPAPCCLGLDPIFGCEIMAYVFWITTEEPSPTAPLPTYEVHEPGDVTDCLEVDDVL